MRFWIDIGISSLGGALRRWQWRLLGSLLAVFAWALAIGLIGYSWVLLQARKNERVLEDRWMSTLAGEPDFLARLPRTARNETALSLDELAAALGLRLAPPNAEDRPVPSDDSEQIWNGVKKPLQTYFRQLISSPEAPLQVPPRELRVWLDSVRPQLAAVIDLLHNHEPPIERLDLARGFEAPLPNLLGYLHLERVLLLAAAESTKEGNREAALRSLDAAWHFAETVHARPEIISQLISHSVLNSQMALLRRLPFAAPGWRERLAAVDPRQGMLTALRVEAWLPSVDRSGESLGVEFALPLRPLMQSMMTAHALTMHDVVQEMAGREVSTFHADEFFAEQYAAVPRYNLVSRILFPNVWDTWPRAHRIALDLDLTGRILQLREPAARSPGGPDGQPQRSPSVIPGLDWIYTWTATEVTIALDGEVDRYRPADRPELPQSFTLPRDGQGTSQAMTDPATQDAGWPGRSRP